MTILGCESVNCRYLINFISLSTRSANNDWQGALHGCRQEPVKTSYPLNFRFDASSNRMKRRDIDIIQARL